MKRSVRFGWSLLALLALPACYGHHTVDESALLAGDADEEVLPADDATQDDLGPVATNEDPCADVDEANVLAQITCDLTQNDAGGQLSADALGGVLESMLGGGEAAGTSTMGDMLSLLSLFTGTGTTQSGGLDELLGLFGDFVGAGEGQQGGLDLTALLGGGGDAAGGLDLASLLGAAGNAGGGTAGNLDLSTLLGQLGQSTQTGATEAP